MTIDMMKRDAHLHALLIEALALADSLGRAITAIHITEALDRIAARPCVLADC